VFAKLGQQFARRRQPDALQALGVVGDEQFGCVAAEDDRGLLSTSTEPLAARCSGIEARVGSAVPALAK